MVEYHTLETRTMPVAPIYSMTGNMDVTLLCPVKPRPWSERTHSISAEADRASGVRPTTTDEIGEIHLCPSQCHGTGCCTHALEQPITCSWILPEESQQLSILTVTLTTFYGAHGSLGTNSEVRKKNPRKCWK